MARYGEVRHSSKRVARAALRSAHKGWQGNHQKVPVTVHISRSVSATRGKGVFEARACINTRATKQWVGKRGMSQQRCGGLGTGSTPTKALNAALRKLAVR